MLDNCTFQYNGVFYQQIFGVPMGSPSSPVFADLFLEILKEDVIKKLGYRLPFFFRYVDDILTTVPKNEVNKIKDVFNKYNVNIQFTVEDEKDNSISFLELLIIREDRMLKADWYNKKNLVWTLP